MWDENKNIERAEKVKPGSRCHVEGNRGTVTDVNRIGTGRDGHTFIKVSFDESTGLVGTHYNNSWYGSYNWAFTYTE